LSGRIGNPHKVAGKGAAKFHGGEASPPSAKRWPDLALEQPPLGGHRGRPPEHPVEPEHRREHWNSVD